MKSPAEYVAAARTEHPTGPVPLMTVAEAETAVAIALADAERYKNNLVGALRHAKPSPTPCSEPSTPQTAP